METPWTTLLIFALVSLLDFTYAVNFKWSTSATLQLGRCVANDTSLGLCAKSINVTCVIKGRGRPIPKYYCRESSISPKPPTLVPCDEKKCRQRCIVSMWSSWNPCDPACVLPFKYRTRRVLLSDGASAVCPALIERSLCAHCSKSSQKEIFFWKVGQWGSCRQFTTITIHQSPVKTRVVATSPQFCAAVLMVGKSTRKVRCADRQGQEVRTRKCLNSKDKYGRITQRPEKTKVCSLPCDCHVSNWSQWSGCTKDCHVTEERRTRDVLYAAQLGGKPCEALEEKRACATQKTCPHYEWYAASWGLCQTQRFPGNSSMSECGHGFQERLVFCIKSSNNNKSISELQPVHNDQCDPRMKHISRKPCHTPCRQDCKVSEWQPWEPCPQGCGQSGIKRKRRTVLQKASHGGRDCPNLVELSPCKRVQCYSWAARQWSMCFVNNGTCGLGERYSFVFCVDYQNKLVKAKDCSHFVKPNAKEPCSNPCPEDCAISHWSEWSPCSKSCGIHGGIQTRYKRILGYPSASGTPCPADEKLVESRKCNSRTFCEHEMNFMWKADPWHMCEPLVKGMCGKFKGIKKRTVHCVTHRQNLGNTSFCPQQLKPAAVNPCDVPCPKNCIVSKWQEWSVCSEMCRSTGVEMRKRFILQEVSHNGTPCPSNMTDGVEIEVQPCTFMPSCYTYRWVASEWKKCTLFPQTRSNCGAGYQTRNVSCLRSDETLVEASFCYKALFTAPPKTLKECWLPCPNYCVRSDWSSWSDCPHNCTTNLPSFRQRTRQVVNLSPARGGWSTTCPQLTPLDFSEKEECPTIFCFSYKWYTGTWGSCVLNEIYCGNGKEERAVLCQRSDKLFVSETYCNNVTKPNSSQSCSVSCSQDCIVSTWGKWTNCSHTCGDSIEKRHRTIVTSSVGFGRLCPNLIEKRLCHEMPCSSFKWSAELWSTCKLNTNSTCGNGTQTRKVICLPDPARESVCMKQAPKPATTQPCELPCPGDCVLSNWGSWSTCVKGRNGCIRKRWSIVVREASLTSLKKCNNESSLNEQRESCDCSSAGTFVPTEWSTCQLNHTSGPNCGKGQQFRSEKCTGEKGQILSNEYCTGKNKIFMMQDCYVKCPVDCILGKWSPWSLCPITCGADGIVMRSRKIIVVGMYGGRICPDKSSLKQKRPCNVKPCYTYTLKKGKWSKCYVDGQGCGYGTQTKQVWCERSDGKLVNLYYCFQHLNRSADTKDLNVLQAVLNNISTLSVSTKQKCEVTCPGDCISHEWSEWSICGRSCFLNASHSTFQTRTRLIIANAITGGKACATDLQQTQACQPDGNTKCIGAKWKIGPWQKNGTRRVWCETSNGLSISEACVFNKPSATKLCEPKCPDPNAVCTDGKCVCKPLFESFQSQCIPINGCLHNGHCIFKNTICKEQECKCREGHERNTTTGPCVWVRGTSTSTNIEITTSSVTVLNTKPTLTSTVLSIIKSTVTSTVNNRLIVLNNKPTVTSTVSDGGNKKALIETNETIPIGYWKWIGIGGGALLFMILLAVGVLCYMRMQNKTKKKHDKKSANSIELIGMLSIPDGENGKPEKV